ncbi:MAG TPA: CDP-alcohol phosphatidyltransferase family protein [Candidatus Limnocylindrales bacterium]|nr:CDP-alcohol phosphatidyltransferase family protein [Candidatus Limnocylindrales bacterium]
MSERSFVSAETRNRIRGAIAPIGVALGRAGISPNALTVAGFAGVCVAALTAAFQWWLAAGVLLLAFGIFDLFDGAVARATGRVSAFGAFLDSTLDRTGENLVLAGIAVGCATAGFPVGVALAALAMAFASVVTYARARAEAVGLKGEVGIAPRPERLVLESAGLILTGVSGGIALVPRHCAGAAPELCTAIVHQPTDIAAPWLALALGIVALTSAITVVQRILYVRKQSLEQKEP